MAKRATKTTATTAKSNTATQNYVGVWDNRLGFGRKSVVLGIDLLKG